jgi:hypothetical protein
MMRGDEEIPGQMALWEGEQHQGHGSRAGASTPSGSPG